MVGMKSAQTRAVYVGIITDNVHPTTYFHATKVSMENVQGCILSVIIPTALVCVLFAPIVPTYYL